MRSRLRSRAVRDRASVRAGLGTGQADDVLLRLPDRRVPRRRHRVGRARLDGAVRARGLVPERAAQHVVAASWLSLAVVAAAAGVFALAGEHGSRAGCSARATAAAPAPSSAGSSSTSRRGWSPRSRSRSRFRSSSCAAVRAGCPCWRGGARLHRCSSSGARAAFGLAGVAVGLGLTTGARARGAARSAAPLALARGRARRGRLRRAGGDCVRPAAARPRPVPAAAYGLVAYVRRAGLLAPRRACRHAWAYVRTLQ